MLARISVSTILVQQRRQMAEQLDGHTKQFAHQTENPVMSKNQKRPRTPKTELPQIVLKQSAVAEERRATRVLLMVHELHKVGYQQLRICPGMSSSGCDWRVAIVPVTNVLRTHGALMANDGIDNLHYTTGQKNEYFGWHDAKNDNARELAAKFIERFPKLAGEGLGNDWEYAGWYVQMLGFAERGELPIAYSDSDGTGIGRSLSTTQNIESGLPMPPPGMAIE